MRRNPRFGRFGFSLVETLVVIGIVGLLLGLLLPAVQRVRDAASRLSCENNLHQIGIACHNYHVTQGTLPPSIIPIQIGHDLIELPWGVLILPYIEQDGLAKQTHDAFLRQPFSYINPPHVGLATVIKTYTCPSDGRLAYPITDDQGFTVAYGSYQGVSGGSRTDDGAMGFYRGINLLEILDGTSQTLLIGERPPPGKLLAGSWYTMNVPDPNWTQDVYSFGGRRPAMPVYWERNEGGCRGPFRFGPGRIENPCDCNHFWSLHYGGANFVFADGSVHFMSYSAVSIMVPLATRAGGEIVDQEY
jgi:prepilin-type processing-associated H-X9-DG protein